jgi:hypothetical protein
MERIMTRKQIYLKIIPAQILAFLAFLLAIFKVIEPIACIAAQIILLGIMILEIFSSKNELIEASTRAKKGL